MIRFKGCDGNCESCGGCSEEDSNNTKDGE